MAYACLILVRRRTELKYAGGLLTVSSSLYSPRLPPLFIFACHYCHRDEWAPRKTKGSVSQGQLIHNITIMKWRCRRTSVDMDRNSVRVYDCNKCGERGRQPGWSEPLKQRVLDCSPSENAIGNTVPIEAHLTACCQGHTPASPAHYR